MRTKGVLVLAAIVAAVAMGGIGFATFTSTASINGSGAAGNIQLDLNGFTDGSSAYGTCDWSNYVAPSGEGPASVTLTVTNLAPGGSCAASLGVIDDGSLPITSLYAVIAGTGGNYCTSPSGGGSYNCVEAYDTLGANLEGPTTSPTTYGSPLLDAYDGNAYTDIVTVSLPSGTTQVVSASFTITYYGAIGS